MATETFESHKNNCDVCPLVVATLPTPDLFLPHLCDTGRRLFRAEHDSDVRGVQVDNPCANHCGHGGDWITQGRCLAPVAIPDGDGEMEQVPCGHVCVLSPAEVCDNEWHGDAKTSACSGCGMSVADVMPSTAETVAIIETQRQE